MFERHEDQAAHARLRAPRESRPCPRTPPGRRRRPCASRRPPGWASRNAAGRGRRAGLDRRSDGGAGGRDRERVDAERCALPSTARCGGSRSRRRRSRSAGVAGRGATPIARAGVAAVEDAEAGERLRRALGLERRRSPRARTRSLHPIALTVPPPSQFWVASCISRGSAGASREHAVQRLERAQRLLAAGSPRISDALEASCSKRAQALRVPALDPDDAARQQRGDERQRDAHRQPPGRPGGARPADQGQDDRRGDEQPGEIADPPAFPSICNSPTSARSAPARALPSRRWRGRRWSAVHAAMKRDDVARLGQRERPPHQPPDQPRADAACSAAPAAKASGEEGDVASGWPASASPSSAQSPNEPTRDRRRASRRRRPARSPSAMAGGRAQQRRGVAGGEGQAASGEPARPRVAPAPSARSGRPSRAASRARSRGWKAVALLVAGGCAARGVGRRRSRR